MKLSVNNKFNAILVLIIALALSANTAALAASLLETAETMDTAATLQGAQSRNRPSMGSKGATRVTRPEQIDVPADIETRYAEMADIVNSGQRPNKADLDSNLQLLKMTPAKVKDLPESTQVKFYLLSAWTNYFDGNIKKAQQAAMRTYRTNSTITDVRITQASMALLAGKRPADPIRTSAASEETEKKDISLLNLDIDEVLSKFIDADVEEMQLQCLNSSTMSFTPGQSSFCVLFWKLAESSSGSFSFTATEPNGMPIKSGKKTASDSGKESGFASSIASFRNIVSSAYANPNIRFAAVNTDSVLKKQAVVNAIVNGSWPWANVMAHDPKSKATQFRPIKVVHEKPLLMLISGAGKIKYAGPADGFLAPMLVGQTANTAIAKPARVTPMQSRTNTATASKVGIDNIIKQAKAPKRELTPAEDFQAGKLLENAKAFIKMGSRYTTPKKGIEMCRQIIKDYPGSSYANEARLLLRKVPERYHKRYSITSEELGL